MSLTHYLDALRAEGTLGPFAATVVGRLPVSMAPLGALVLVQSVTGSYALAGLVTGAFAAGTAVGGPWWGSCLDRRPHAWVIASTSLGSSAALAVLAVAAVHHGSATVLVALATLSGLVFPPLGPAMRETWRQALGDQLRATGFALDAVAVETMFVVGPLLLSLLVVRTAPVVPLLLTAVLLAAGGAGYSLTPTVRRQGRRQGAAPRPGRIRRRGRGRRRDYPRAAARPRRSVRPALGASGVVPMLAVAAAMSVGFGHVDTSLAATARGVLGDPAVLGWLFTAIAGGSAVGGLVYGARRPTGREHRFLPRLLGAFALGLLPLPVLVHLQHPPLWALMGSLFAAGLAIAPVLIIQQNVIDRLSSANRVSEAQSWLSTSSTTGAAVGTAVAGLLVDRVGVAWSFAGAACAAVLACTLSVLGQHSWQHGAAGAPAVAADAQPTGRDVAGARRAHRGPGGRPCLEGRRR